MKWVVTGGCGFIGTNTVKRLLERGHDVVVIDNLSRPGSERNLDYLDSLGYEFPFVGSDISSPHDAVWSKVHGADVVLHLAAQTAVTCSFADRHADFSTNVLGTISILEACKPGTLF